MTEISGIPSGAGQEELIADINAESLALKKQVEVTEDLQARMDWISRLVVRHGMEEQTQFDSFIRCRYEQETQLEQIKY